MSLENTQAKVPTAPKDDGPVAPAPPAEGHGAHGGINLPVLEKLKQHHVGRVALLYLGLSWIILEPVHVVFHMLDVPEWANRLVIVVIVLGFPLTVIPAWIYAATPATMKPDALQARHSGAALGDVERELGRWNRSRAERRSRQQRCDRHQNRRSVAVAARRFHCYQPSRGEISAAIRGGMPSRSSTASVHFDGFARRPPSALGVSS